ncbi:thermostable carboxypeptidase 2 [[Clostridium] sordellii]|uniref:M20 metallopeptidase family protein n=1 Tax=Paraclostridium sordellii TaxID=1505 RepID=UPI0005E7BA6F|nr:M20 family metallopeptidase [Paeniclostridium sordellii]MBX9180458.1 amidohydrolase [Paeniclostridium sordellii]CEN82422.1 thermostable carboxypeptidase 2 [[Clostridium] sordellii] [Paeniclostridium sordellii]CEO07748.1 thermostable carboxypeptidase 2 [[Clostridium] sordellii] [Paeniclostridium sordellii]CEO09814.1 thermostable carboxypeptidase 2 [[Clostridium] sordellii] [Paeniclostridium sordellii]CEP84523.1 thermostable carboxypeptidase 2 [[Clostridium] sordellii] [Paeniclostridium sorde
MENFIKQAKLIKEDLLDYRRTIHSNPEVGDKLPKTKAFVMDKLREFGYEPIEICESGIVATIEGNKSSKTFLLRADMDALPMKEDTNCDFKSNNGCMHSCGHDMHTAMLLGAAKLLKQNKDQIEGTVKLVFQPDEEGFTGAKKMINAGVLENPKVNAAMAMHVHSGTPSNVVLYGLGTSIAGCNRFRIVVKGTGCHGAMPETGVDPINIAAHIYLSLQEITSREIPSTKPTVLTIGKFVGGDAPNIIPKEVIMEGTIRSLDKELGQFIFNRINDIVKSTAKMFRGEAELIELSSVPPLANDTNLAKELGSYVKDLVGEKGVVEFEGGGMGSEDFASYSYEVPSVYFMLGAGTKQENPLYGEPMHNNKVVFNEDIMVTGAAMHAYCAIKWLKNNK